MYAFFSAFQRYDTIGPMIHDTGLHGKKFSSEGGKHAKPFHMYAGVFRPKIIQSAPFLRFCSINSHTRPGRLPRPVRKAFKRQADHQLLCARGPQSGLEKQEAAPGCSAASCRPGMIQSPGTPGQFFQCAGICPGLFTDSD